MVESQKRQTKYKIHVDEIQKLTNGSWVGNAWWRHRGPWGL